MSTRTARILLTVLALLLGQRAMAGLLDSPPPTFDGVTGQVVYRMAPIYYQPGRIDTVITCTNLDDTEVTVAIELFDGRDLPIGTLASKELSVGDTAVFVTSADPVDDTPVVIQDLPEFDHGKARVSATTAKLSCTGYHRVRSVDGTTRDTPLALVKKVSPNVQR